MEQFRRESQNYQLKQLSGVDTSCLYLSAWCERKKTKERKELLEYLAPNQPLKKTVPAASASSMAGAIK